MDWVEWKTITEKDQVWYAHTLDSSNKGLDCVNLPTGINKEIFIKNNWLYFQILHLLIYQSHIPIHYPWLKL